MDSLEYFNDKSMHINQTNMVKRNAVYIPNSAAVRSINTDEFFRIAPHNQMRRHQYENNNLSDQDENKSDNELWSMEEPTLEDTESAHLNSLSMRSRQSSNPVTNYQNGANLANLQNINIQNPIRRN